MTHIYFVAGESSGDMHGANVIRALHQLDPAIECHGLGGRRMEAAGMALDDDLAGRAIMGFTEVVRHLGAIRRLFWQTVRHLEAARPDCLVLIDYPGFNLRLAAQAHRLGIPVVYYIGPQVWAWKRKRIHTIARLVRKMLVILPFEEPLYREAGVDCQYVGHPLLDEYAHSTPKRRFDSACTIAILPGSREQEIRRIFGILQDVARRIHAVHPESRFVVPCVDAQREAQVRSLIADLPIETVVGQSRAVLASARFCLVASGTATLETALHGVPMAVVYRVSPLTYWLARRLVRLEHIALVNILAGHEVVPEFIQDDATPKRIAAAALRLVADSPEREAMKRGLAEVRARLGSPGASKRAAEAILGVAAGGSGG